MIVTREYLDEKRADLMAQYERCIADANAASGGIQVIDAMLARLDEEPEE